MTDAGQRGVEVDHIAGNVVQTARQSLGAGKHALCDAVPQHVDLLELVAMLLVAGLQTLGVVMLHGVLSVRWHHTVQRHARRLFPDFQLRVTLHQFLTECRHADDATPSQRRDGQHVTPFPEHLREVVIHSAGNALVLLPAQFRQFAHTRLQLALGRHELLTERLTGRRQQLLLISHLQQRVHLPIHHRIPIIPRAVTRIVADIKRPIALRGLGEFHVVGLPIRIVVTVSTSRISLQLVHHCQILAPRHRCRHQQQQHPRYTHNRSFSHLLSVVISC